MPTKVGETSKDLAAMGAITGKLSNAIANVDGQLSQLEQEGQQEEGQQQEDQQQEGPGEAQQLLLEQQQQQQLEQLQQLATAASVDEGLRALAAVDAAAAQALQHQVATAVEQRSAAYLARHGDRVICIGAVLFDRSRRLCAEGPSGSDLLQAFRARDLG